MSDPRLGRLKRVDLRKAWLSESRDFTPWLAQEENLSLLGEALGLDLELEFIEKGVGPFRADIVCKDTVSDSYVLIENQLERTDHGHLGQLLTYAAGLNAVTIVWIAAQFTDEHRAALTWLNDVTGQDINFFGLEVELWSIDDSPFAPKFNTIAQPNNWLKTVSTLREAGGERTELQELKLEYWTRFGEYVSKNSTSFRPRPARADHNMIFSIGASDFTLSAFWNNRDNRIGVSLRMSGTYSKVWFSRLESQRTEIEDEIGEKLVWSAPASQNRKYILLNKSLDDPRNQIRWPEQHKWLLDNLESFRRVFSPRINMLKKTRFIQEDNIAHVSEVIDGSESDYETE